MAIKEHALLRLDPKDLKELLHIDPLQRILAAYFLLLKSQELEHGK